MMTLFTFQKPLKTEELNFKDFLRTGNSHVLVHRMVSIYIYIYILHQLKFLQLKNLTTVWDSAFLSHPWLLKPHQEGTRVLKARVVSEQTFEMLKGR